MTDSPGESASAERSSRLPDATHHTLAVQRTARYSVLGDPSAGHHLFVLHGYGQRAQDFIRPFAAIAQDDRCIIAPEALSRFYTDDLGEHSEVGASWMTKEAREAEIDDYVAYLDSLAASLTGSAGAAPTRAGSAQTGSASAARGHSPTRTVLGFSQGAATATRWALLGNTPVDRLVLWAGSPAHDLDYATHADSLRAMSPTFVVGDDDPWITEERREQVTRMLAARDIPVEMHTFPGGHRLSRDVLRTLFP
jgi:predicted esterase